MVISFRPSMRFGLVYMPDTNSVATPESAGVATLRALVGCICYLAVTVKLAPLGSWLAPLLVCNAPAGRLLK
jgi:hypothetical protein